METMKIMKPNGKLFGNAIYQARGNKGLSRFAFDCGMTPRTMYSYANQQRVYCKKDVERVSTMISDRADPASGITEDGMLAAGGLLKSDYVRAAYLKYLKDVCKRHADSGKTGSYDYQAFYEKIEARMTEKEKLDENFLQYLEDLSFFSATLERKEIREIKKRLYKISKEPTLVKLLHDFHAEALRVYENDTKKLFESFKTHDASLIPTKAYGLSGMYQVLKDLLLDY